MRCRLHRGGLSAAYGIDLTADKVHWWRFKALLHALPPETPLGKIVEIRGKDTSGMDRADRDYYETLKERFALPEGLKGVRRNETLQEPRGRFPRPLRLIPAPRCPAPSAAERCPCGRLPRPAPTVCG